MIYIIVICMIIMIDGSATLRHHHHHHHHHHHACPSAAEGKLVAMNASFVGLRVHFYVSNTPNYTISNAHDVHLQYLLRELGAIGYMIQEYSLEAQTKVQVDDDEMLYVLIQCQSDEYFVFALDFYYKALSSNNHNRPDLRHISYLKKDEHGHHVLFMTGWNFRRLDTNVLPQVQSTLDQPCTTTHFDVGDTRKGIRDKLQCTVYNQEMPLSTILTTPWRVYNGADNGVSEYRSIQTTVQQPFGKAPHITSVYGEQLQDGTYQLRFGGFNFGCCKSVAPIVKGLYGHTWHKCEVTRFEKASSGDGLVCRVKDSQITMKHVQFIPWVLIGNQHKSNVVTMSGVPHHVYTGLRKHHAQKHKTSHRTPTLGKPKDDAKIIADFQRKFKRSLTAPKKT